MHYGDPQLIAVLLLAAGALAALALFALARDRKDLEKLGFRNLVLGPKTALARRTGIAVLLVAGLVLSAMGASRLQGKLVPQDMESVGMDVMMALDVSKSMLVNDVPANRLDAAKRSLLEFISAREGDRIGLTVFAGEAAVQVPLTLDLDAVATVLDRADVDALDRGGTDIGDALRAALDAFPEDEEGEAAKRGKAVLVVTDGELTREASNVDATLAEAKKRGILVLTVGMGTREGRPIPDGVSIWGDTIYKKDEGGRVVVSRLNERLLRRIAAETGGTYVSADSAGALSSLGRVLDRMQKTAMKGKGVMKREELAPAVGAATAAVLLLAFLL